MSHDDCACPISAELSIEQPLKNQRSRVAAAWVPFWAVPRSHWREASARKIVYHRVNKKSRRIGFRARDGSKSSGGGGRDKPAPTEKNGYDFRRRIFLAAGRRGAVSFSWRAKRCSTRWRSLSKGCGRWQRSTARSSSAWALTSAGGMESGSYRSARVE